MGEGSTVLLTDSLDELWYACHSKSDLPSMGVGYGGYMQCCVAVLTCGMSPLLGLWRPLAMSTTAQDFVFQVQALSSASFVL